MLNRRSIFAFLGLAAAAPAAVATAAAARPPFGTGSFRFAHLYATPATIDVRSGGTGHSRLGQPRLFIGMSSPALSNKARFVAGLDGGPIGTPRYGDIWRKHEPEGVAYLVFSGLDWIRLDDLENPA